MLRLPNGVLVDMALDDTSALAGQDALTPVLNDDAEFEAAFAEAAAKAGLTTEDGEVPAVAAADQPAVTQPGAAAAASDTAVIDGAPKPDFVANPQAATVAATVDPAKAAAEKAAADAIWANATPQQRAAFEAAQERAQKLEHTAQSDRGRVTALTRQITELRSKGGIPIPTGPAAAPSGAAAPAVAGAAPKLKALDSTAMQALGRDYTEVAAPIRELGDEVGGRLAGIENRLAARDRADTTAYIENQAQAVVEAHPDAAALVVDPAFKAWSATQPRYVQDALLRNGNAVVDAVECIDIFDRFKQSDAYGAVVKPTPRAAQQPAPANPQASVRDLRKRSAIAVPQRGSAPAQAEASEFDAAFDEAASKVSRAAAG